MTTDNQDQNAAGTPEGVPNAGQVGSDIAKRMEEMERRLSDSDRKVTELQNEKTMIERRLEEVSSVRQPQHQQVQTSAFDKPFEQVALGNTSEGARSFEEALEIKARQMEQRIQAQNEAKQKYEGHIAAKKAEKEFVKEFDEELKMAAIVNFQKAVQSGKPITPEAAYDAAVEQIEKKVSRLIPKTEPQVPKGAMGERGGAGGSPEITQKKEDTSGETPADYLAARKARMMKLETK
jgi:hypothetical protein